MPIHDQSYRHWHGTLKGHRLRWWVITRMGIRLILKRKLSLIFLTIPYIAVVVFGVMMYIASNFPESESILKFDEFFYLLFLYITFTVYEFLAVIFLGSGLITRDFKYNALPLYLAKPLTYIDYIAGKFGIIAFFILLTSWLPSFIIMVLNTIFLEKVFLSGANLLLIGRVTVYSVLGASLWGLLILALSALSRTRRNTIILFIGILYFGQIFFRILDSAFNSDLFSLLAVFSSFRQVGCLIFSQPLPYDFGWYWSLLVLLGLIMLSGYILFKRIKKIRTVAG